MNLRFALVCEAVQRVLFEAKRPVRSPAWLEDMQWLFSDEVGYPLAFLPLCGVLDIDHEWIRERIYDALSRGDPLDSPTLASGRKRCRLAGLIVLDEAKARRQAVAAA